MRGLARLERQRRFWGVVMLLPLVAGLTVFYLVPLAQGMFYSFTDLGMFGRWTHFTFDNYRQLLHDDDLLQALANTAFYCFVCVPAIVILSLLLALALNAKMRGIAVYRTLLFLPAVTMPVAIALIWKWIFGLDFGLLNQALAGLSLSPVAWLADSHLARIVISIVVVWSSLSVNMLILLAGLQAVPAELHEAAWIDGAGPIARFFHVTLPMLVPTLVFVAVNTMIGLLQIFDVIFMMIGPNSLAEHGTMSVVFLFYKYAFDGHAKGYASVIALVLLTIIMLVTVAQLRVGRYLTRWKETSA